MLISLKRATAKTLISLKLQPNVNFPAMRKLDNVDTGHLKTNKILI